ncbi:MAG: fimbria/pilus periplasmic chaperone [Methyloprofundus sp.]|nr:fimbria/pilus periplasmic chaperone [Methyloprofundus sp.]
MMKTRYIFSLFLLGFIIAVPVQANMVVNKIIINFYSGKTAREDVEVFNSGKEALYISAKLFEIIQPESKAPERRELTDPRDAGIIISPNRFIVAPGQRKVVRLITTQSAIDKDKVYRILMQPHAGKFTTDSTQKAAGIKIILGYELLAFIRPANLDASLQVQRKGKSLALHNTGNTNINVREIKLCQDTEQQHCEILGGKRLYSGQQWQLNLPQAEGQIFIRKSVGNAFSVDEY